MQRWFDVKKTQIEMVADRGYAIPEEEREILTMSLSDFINYLTTISGGTRNRQALSQSYTLLSPPTSGPQKCFVFFGGRESADNKQVPVGVIHKFTDIIGVVDNVTGKPIYREAILIVDADISSSGNNNLSAVRTVPYQVFHDSSLTYNPVRHISVPRHELLSEEETALVLKEMKIDPYSLLLIQSDEIIVKYYGWPLRRIVRVYRDDSAINIMNPHSINYRLIVDNPKK